MSETVNRDPYTGDATSQREAAEHERLDRDAADRLAQERAEAESQRTKYNPDTKTDYTPVIPDRPDPVEVPREELPEDPHEEAYEYRQEGGPEFSDGTIPTPGTVHDPLMWVEPDPAEIPEPGDTLQIGELAALRAKDDERTGVIGRGAAGRGGEAARRGRSGSRTVDEDAPNVDDIGRFSGSDKEAARAATTTTVDDDDDIEEGYDPADYSVDEVNAYIDENPEYADEILALEAEGKNRKGIVERHG